MDSTLFNAVITGNIDVISTHINNHSTDQLLKLRIPFSNNTILHLVSQSGHTEAVRAILSKHSLLLSQVNSHGDSALHLAARGGHAGVVRALIDYAKKLNVDQAVESGPLQTWEGISRSKNKRGDTAIHEATRYNHIQVVTMLLQEDLEFKHSGNGRGETPLYLAASRGTHDLVDVITKACKASSDYYGGPDCRTALHGAVICNSQDCTTKLLQWHKTLVHVRDKYSQTPLHYAVQLGFANLVSELISVDASIAYVANGKGRNVLHIAIEHDQKKVIEYLLEEYPWLINILIIEKDNDGNTPLHLLATSGCFVPKLIQHPMADKGALNNSNLTPLDLVIYNDDNKSSTSEAKNAIVEELKRVGAILHLQNAPAPPALDDEARTALLVRKMVDNHMIVAALIATVAFTAGFAMPGGYIQSGSDNQGMAVLSRNSVAFQAFVISDVVALLFSTSALFTYFISGIYNHDGEEGKLFNYYAGLGGMVLNMLGLGAIIVAFITGTYAVLRYSYALAIATCVIASCIFLFHFTILMKHLFALGKIEEMKKKAVSQTL